ncbi:hypothetical protein BH24ACT3_BH24ACT3_01070 [soil metagenome]
MPDGTASPRAAASPWDEVVGQPQAVTELQAAARSPLHAYLFVGPRGSGKRAAARAFAAELLARDREPAEADRQRRLTMAETHPDLVVVEPAGRTVRRIEAQALIDAGHRAPIEGRHKVLLGVGFHAPEPAAMAALLKVVEEPPPSAVFVLLAHELPPELVTIASRCVQIRFRAVPDEQVVARLVADGAEVVRATDVAAAAKGDLGRARLLVADERFALRREAWRAAPGRLDGTGAAVATLASELRAAMDDAQVPLEARQAAEREEAAERSERYGGRKTALKELDEAHKRERRLRRDDELRLGLATLAGAYRDALVSADRPETLLDACARIQGAAEALIRNPNEQLLLEALFAALPPLAPAR